ncbi:hypothetical protein AWB74_02213 [Caballeronia arvi]|uniref:Uncharacterized protein n=1 Tax=Caballeronia arvi TaxID=1777135 RepID=A0A158HXB4_9BURK|nr:hypothetical protein [Caballeronia arvi]SAL48360.1 hypothetical protein AWB74_02213 [Caballeronia arvi]
MRDFSWCDRLNEPDTIVRPVLNGGFSLRSRRLLRALIDQPQIRVEIPPPEVRETEPIRMHWFNNVVNEDVQLTAALRPQLEAVRIRYAPLPLCMRFALEEAGPVHAGMSVMRLFGLHGWRRRLVSIDSPIVRYGIPQSAIDESPYEPSIKKLLEHYGYGVQVAPKHLDVPLR